MFLPFRQPEHKAHSPSRSKNAVPGLVDVVSARISAPKKIWRFRPTFSVLSDWQPLLLGFSNLAKYQGRPCF